MRLKALIERHFFKPADAQSLSLFRFLYCATLVWKITGGLASYEKQFAKGMYNPIPLFELFGFNEPMSFEVFPFVHYALLLSLVVAGIGLFTRTALTASWVLFFIYFGTVLGFSKSAHTNYVYHSKNIVVFVLLILSLAPGNLPLHQGVDATVPEQVPLTHLHYTIGAITLGVLQERSNVRTPRRLPKPHERLELDPRDPTPVVQVVS